MTAVTVTVAQHSHRASDGPRLTTLLQIELDFKFTGRQQPPRAYGIALAGVWAAAAATVTGPAAETARPGGPLGQRSRSWCQ
jgi:hypothetical protein